MNATEVCCAAATIISMTLLLMGINRDNGSGRGHDLYALSLFTWLMFIAYTITAWISGFQRAFEAVK